LVQNRTHDTQTTAADPIQRHSPLYLRTKRDEIAKREDSRFLMGYDRSLIDDLRGSSYSRETIDDRYDADLRKQYGWGF